MGKGAPLRPVEWFYPPKTGWTAGKAWKRWIETIDLYLNLTTESTEKSFNKTCREHSQMTQHKTPRRGVPPRELISSITGLYRALLPHIPEYYSFLISHVPVENKSTWQLPKRMTFHGVKNPYQTKKNFPNIYSIINGQKNDSALRSDPLNL